MSDSKGAAIREQLEKLEVPKMVVWLDKELSVTTNHLTEKTVDEILAILAQEVKRVIGEDEDLEVLKPLPGMQKDAWARNGLRAEMRRKAGLV